MSRNRNIGTIAALGGVTAVVALLTGLPSASADELSDAQAKNQLLQQRLDQLAQLPAVGSPVGGLYPGGPPSPVAGAGIVGGSFPRSFLIPGTDTSLRVGGEIRENLLYFFNGGNPNNMPATSNVLNNGAINSTPYNIHNNVVGGVVVPSSSIARSRSTSIFYQTPMQSKINFETRTPTAFGEARTFMEWDWNSSGAFAPNGVNSLTSTTNLTPRLRYAYGTLGGFLAGQANSNFADPDADPPSQEFGGQVGNPASPVSRRSGTPSRWLLTACWALCRSRRKRRRPIPGQLDRARSRPTPLPSPRRRTRRWPAPSPELEQPRRR